MNEVRVEKLLENIGGIIFNMEGDAQTEDGKEFIWNDYGANLYKFYSELELHLRDEIKYWKKIHKLDKASKQDER